MQTRLNAPGWYERLMLRLKPVFSLRVAVMATALSSLVPRIARAEDLVSYKFQSWQEDGGRIRVDAHYALVEKDLGLETKLKVTGLVDAIAGATPNGQPAPAGSDQVPLSQLTDRRKAWSADVSHQLRRSNLTLGYAQSRESDYISKGWSLNSLTDFNEKNTTLLVGYARVDDDITARFLPAPRIKTGDDVVIGVTQLINPRTSLTLNVTRGIADGYLSDPYKIIQKNTEILPGLFLPLTFPENRPERREKWIVFSGANLAFEKIKGALDTSYRFYRDDFGVQSHTLALEWFQSVGERLILRPSLRVYRQGSADFYRVSLNGSSIVPASSPTGQGPFYSADYRLSELETVNAGLKVIWTIVPERLLVDAAYERYTMRGRDSVTSASAYPDADVFTLGGRFTCCLLYTSPSPRD